MMVRNNGNPLTDNGWLKRRLKPTAILTKTRASLSGFEKYLKKQATYLETGKRDEEDNNFRRRIYGKPLNSVPCSDIN